VGLAVQPAQTASLGLRWTRGRRRFGSAGCGIALTVVGLIACGSSSEPGDVPALDALAGDISVHVPMSCADWRENVPVVTGVDPATHCPTSIRVDHVYSGPGTCDTVRACCTFRPSCVFETRYVLSIPGPCGGLERQPPATGGMSGCTCVDGHVSCPTYQGAITSACLDCFIGSALDGGRDVPMGPDVQWSPDVSSGHDGSVERDQ